MPNPLLTEDRRRRVIAAGSSQAIEDPVGFVPVGDYVRLTPESETWLIEPLLPLSGSILLHSEPKTGKSALSIQLMHALSGKADNWLGFPVRRKGRVLCLQADTPRATWGRRFRILTAHGWQFDSDAVRIADRRSLDIAQLDLTRPAHADYIRSLIRLVAEEPVPAGADYPPVPLVVIVDTLRKVHSGDENSSTEMQVVLDNIKRAVEPSALMLIAHANKPGQFKPSGAVASSRGTGGLPGDVDVVMFMTAGARTAKIQLVGRDVGGEDLKLEKKVFLDPDRDPTSKRESGVITWGVIDEREDDNEKEILTVLANKALHGLREHGKALAAAIGVTPGAGTQRIKRFIHNNPGLVPTSKEHLLPGKEKAE